MDKGYFVASSPEDAVTFLQKEGFEKALLTGGATTNSSFAKAGLIHEMILNVEPIVLGKGLSLFLPADFQLSLELLESKPMNNLLQLRYKVIV